MRASESAPDPGGTRALVAIVASFAVLAAGYGLAVPVFNAPDEPHHFDVARHIARHGALPNQAVADRATSNEGFNPPLYYALVAALLPVVSSDLAADLTAPDYRELGAFARRPQPPAQQAFHPPLNPRYRKWGHGSEPNMFVRTQDDRFPFAGSMRAIHLLRLASIPFGVVTLICVFRIATLLFPGERQVALAAVAACAFNPQFAFVHAYLNNDAAATAFASLALWLATRHTVGEPLDARGLVALGGCTGLGVLTKVNVAFVVPLALLAIHWRSRRDHAGIGAAARDAALVLGPLALVCGWYFVRSVVIYGLDDPLGWALRAQQNPELALSPRRRGEFLRQVFFHRVFTSWWGQFDWLTLRLPPWQYRVYGAVSLLGVVGVGAWVRGRAARSASPRTRQALGLAALAFALAFAQLVALNFTFLSAQGRLLFPVVAPACVFLALGLRSVTRTRWIARLGAAHVAQAFVLLLLALDVYALVGVVAPAYP